MSHVHVAAGQFSSSCPHCRALSRKRRFQAIGSRPTSAASLAATAASSKAGRTANQRVFRSGGLPLRKGRILIKGGTVLSMDPGVGNLADGDVLVEGSKIVAIGRNLEAADAQLVDASSMIVMPGFIDTHRHMWQGFLRNFTPDGTLEDYLRDVLIAVAPHYTPEDVYAGNLLSAVGALNTGITTILDWSHISNTPEHSDAAIQGLRDSHMRAVYAYSHANDGNPSRPRHKYPDDIRRIRSEHFNSADDLVTLAMAAAGPDFGSPEMAAKEWAIAREVGARITTHIGVSTFGNQGKFEQLSKLVKLADDATYIHCSTLNDTEWNIIRDTGGTVSIAPEVEMNMGHGMPPFQRALDLGIRPSLSIDVETNVASDMFSQLRISAALQRALVFERRLAGESDTPALLTSQEVLEFATIEGARASGLDHKTGSLTIGKEADIILLRTGDLNVAPVNDAAGAVVHAMDASNVDTILVAGNPVKVNGALVGLDMEGVVAGAIKARDRAIAASGFHKKLVQ